MKQNNNQNRIFTTKLDSMNPGYFGVISANHTVISLFDPGGFGYNNINFI